MVYSLIIIEFSESISELVQNDAIVSFFNNISFNNSELTKPDINKMVLDSNLIYLIIIILIYFGGNKIIKNDLIKHEARKNKINNGIIIEDESKLIEMTKDMPNFFEGWKYLILNQINQGNYKDAINNIGKVEKHLDSYSIINFRNGDKNNVKREELRILRKMVQEKKIDISDSHSQDS